MNIEPEKEMEETLGLKHYLNFSVQALDKYQKALEQSRAIGRIVDVSYNRIGEIEEGMRAVYFLNGKEVAKFIYALNHPKENIIDLSEASIRDIFDEICKKLMLPNGDISDITDVSMEDLLNEIYKRNYKELLER